MIIGHPISHVIFFVCFIVSFMFIMNRMSYSRQPYFTTFALYLLWAGIQQAPFIAVYYTLEHSYLMALSMTIFFGAFYHFPNLGLMAFTGIFGLIHYFMLYVGLNNFVSIIICHAFCGAWLKENKYEMRAWFSYINRNKKQD